MSSIKNLKDILKPIIPEIRSLNTDTQFRHWINQNPELARKLIRTFTEFIINEIEQEKQPE